MLLAGCSKDADISNSTLSGNGEKTPLTINATINTDRAGTRASGNNFVSGDELLTYVRHVTGGNAINNYTYVSDTPNDGYNKLVTYTKGSAAMGNEDAYKVRETSDLTSTAYWDDFSNSSSADTYLRTGGHGLQSYYGYCYNGGSPNSLTEASGVLTWTVQTNQSTAAAVQHSDLLWSPTQEKVAYYHESSHDANHGTLTIPYKHAMSEITVTVIAEDGFSGSPLTYTVLTLNEMNTKSSLTATNLTFTPSIQTNGDYINPVNMYAEPYTSGLTRNFTAIVAPGTKLKEGNLLLNITTADRNNYTVNITGEMVDGSHWASGHAADQYGNLDSDGHNCVITQPGKNYHLDVTIKKSAVQAHSSLANWTDVNATANGDIYFPDDVDVIIDDSYDGTDESKLPVNVEIIDKDQFDNGASFSLFRVQATGDNTANLENDSEAPKDYATRTNALYAFESISTFTNTGGTPDDYWTNTPELYWPNNSAKFYYRALAKFNGSTGVAPNIVNNIEKVGTIPSDKGTSVSQGGNDILWGTTPKHYGYTYQKTYEKSYPIPPRTHGVPIVFEHAMSKVSFTLETTSDAAATVNLSEASFVVSGLFTSGTILIDNGEISNKGEVGGTTISATATVSPGISTTLISNLIVVPQTFDVSDKVTITLPSENNAVYSIPLANCTVSGGNTSSAWERGKNYNYTIHVEKEKVQLKVMVKDWDVVNGSGNAALEWY